MFPNRSCPTVRGAIKEIDDDYLVLSFESSNFLWDETDIAEYGGDLTVSGNVDSANLQVGQGVIAKGCVVPPYQRKDVETREIKAEIVYPNRFEPFGIDWKVTAVFGILLALSLWIGITLWTSKKLLFMRKK